MLLSYAKEARPRVAQLYEYDDIHASLVPFQEGLQRLRIQDARLHQWRVTDFG